MEQSNNNGVVERWLPFKTYNGEVLRYRIGNDEFFATMDALFMDRFGGYDPTDKEHVNLRREMKSRAFDCGHFCAVDDEMAYLLSGGVLGSPDGQGASETSSSISEHELKALDLLCSEGELFLEAVVEALPLGDVAVQSVLDRLVYAGLVVVKTDGRFVLTHEGLLAWADAKFEGGPVGDVNDMLEITQRWQGVCIL